MTLKIIASVLLLTSCLPIAGCRLANSHPSPLEAIRETTSPVRTPGISPRVTPTKDGSALLNRVGNTLAERCKDSS